MEDLKKILGQRITPIDNQDLKDYITGKFTKEEEHSFEMNLSEEDPFVNDAIEGLKTTQKDLDITLYEINKSVHKKLQGSTKKRKRTLQNSPNTIIAIALILLLITLGYIVIYMYKK
jgi:hypothetical protein